MLDTKNNIIPLLKDVCIFGGGVLRLYRSALSYALLKTC